LASVGLDVEGAARATPTGPGRAGPSRAGRDSTPAVDAGLGIND